MSFQRALLLGAGAIVLAACTSSGHSSSPHIYGAGTPNPLVIASAVQSDQPTLDEATARRTVEHPFATSGTGRKLVFFGLGRVTVTGLTAEGTPIPVYRNRLAWVGVYQLGSLGPHSCPGQRLGPVPSLPPAQKHYFDAVIVDPMTGQQALWNEDASGQLLRDCGAYVASPSPTR